MIGAIITGVVSIALGFYVARLWAPTAGWSALIGLMCGGVCALMFFGGSVLVGQLVPHSMDPKQIGYWFKIVVFAAPVTGALGAFFGYRRSPEFQQD
jgi:hypothetical protein